MSEAAVDELMSTVTAAGVKTLAAVLPMIDDAVMARINAISDPQARCEALHAHTLSMLPLDESAPSGAFASAGLLIACARHTDKQEAQQ